MSVRGAKVVSGGATGLVGVNEGGEPVKWRGQVMNENVTNAHYSLR